VRVCVCFCACVSIRLSLKSVCVLSSAGKVQVVFRCELIRVSVVLVVCKIDKMSSEDYDWIFDFVLQFLESDKFDAAVMDFVDEKCFVFDCEEENKFIYTDIHKEFKEHIEALISSNLGELGITPEIFLDSCEKARNSRDINKQVFERMLAMDDFDTFKKIMVKRNVELQLEAMQTFAEWDLGGRSFSSTIATLAEGGELPDSEELRAISESNLESAYEDLSMLDDEKVTENIWFAL
jgi:hypothetical protein